MKVIYSDKHTLHDPVKFMVGGFMVDHPEKPERAEILLNASREFGLELTEPESYELKYIKRLHTDRYINYLQTIYTRWSRRSNLSLIHI